MLLHGYWRSTASYRVRIALNMKGIAYRQARHDLRTGMQAEPDYAALNPQRLVPAIETGDEVVTQSLAMLEWLEETHPSPTLLPADPPGRAVVRAMANVIACDIHPLNNLRVLKALRQDLAADETQISAWIARWIQDGFTAIEALIAQHGRGFAFGAAPTMADCCLVPQLYSAMRFDVDLAEFPRIVAAAAEASVLSAFADAHPDRQPDAD